MLSVRELVLAEIEKENKIPIKAFITNAGKYNEGDLIGKWHSFPTTPEALAETLESIGIDGVNYEEWFITDYKTSIDGIKINEFENLDVINYLANKIDNLEEWDYEHLEAVLQYESKNVTDVINLLEENNLDCYHAIYDVHEDEDLGYYYVEETGGYDTSKMGELAEYIDYESFGRSKRHEENGRFIANGYVTYGGGVTLEFDGAIENIPEEYRVANDARSIVMEKAIAKERERREKPAARNSKSINARIKKGVTAEKSAQENPAKTAQKSKKKNDIEI